MTDTDPAVIFRRLQQTIAKRLEADPESSYVANLVTAERGQLLKKVVEEATEVILADCAGESPENDRAVAEESADLLFHLLVLLARRGMRFEQVVDVLAGREGLSGLQEKQFRSSGNTR